MRKNGSVKSVDKKRKRKQPTQALQKSAPDEAASQPASLEKSREKLLDELLATPAITGIQSKEFADHIVAHAAQALVSPRANNATDVLIKGMYAMKEMAPRDATEAMLAAQMIAVNDAAHVFLSNATRNGQSSEAADLNVLRATRLMRVFIEQIETMQRLKGKAGHQRVVVEHVHVHAGGQAIVGEVNAARETEGRGKTDSGGTTP